MNAQIDSLDTVEILMLLEESFDLKATDDLFTDPGALKQLQEIFCKPIIAPWIPPDTNPNWATEVTIFAQEERKVLFNVSAPNSFGVGCLCLSKKIKNVRIYHSLSRALYAFPHHECES